MSRLSTRTIFGKRAISYASTEDYAAWAGDMLVDAYDSHSLRILAGLDKFATTHESEQYFLRAIEELHLGTPSPEKAIRDYACELAEQIVDGSMSALDGVRMLYRICSGADYPADLIICYQLDEARSSLDSAHFPYSYPSMTLENFDEITKREAAAFIASICNV